MVFSKHNARKRFGQHWLKDDSVLIKILEAANLQPDDRVLEVGPGRGALTERLLASEASVVHAVELDRDLVAGLRKRFADQSRFTLQQGDVLSAPLTPPDGAPANKVVANIPYNITGPLLERLLGRLNTPVENTYQLLVLLLQKEVADRILAKPGQSSFSALSVRIQLLANCRSICLVPPSSFQPPPKVQSRVIALEPFKTEERLEPDLARQVELLIRTAFLGRRKKLRNTLACLCPLSELELLARGAGINLNQRPQDLSPATWVSLAKEMKKIDYVFQSR